MDQEDQGDHNPPWWTRTGFYILLMKYGGIKASRGSESQVERKSRRSNSFYAEETIYDRVEADDSD